MDWFQAARQFWKKNCGQDARRKILLSEADPCMLYKEDEKRGFLYHHNLH